MPIAYLTRRERFSAAHRLYKQELTDEENFRLFGQCSHPNWHGHNYELFVTIKGEVNQELGYVVNLKVVSQIIKERIISKLDHKNVNIDVDFMQGVLATTENLAIAIWKELEKPLSDVGAQLHCIKIKETENNFVEYYGD
ncbi:MAG: 6-carboxytetrahydropterin synthase [Tenuifilum sp.]|uniref:6-carboxytetrahydropterin synthase n=1 Tax=Tenuifilum sp. TaxID=2760880 RepID=UPI00309F829D